jgi:hypothetical protein
MLDISVMLAVLAMGVAFIPETGLLDRSRW